MGTFWGPGRVWAGSRPGLAPGPVQACPRPRTGLPQTPSPTPGLGGTLGSAPASPEPAHPRPQARPQGWAGPGVGLAPDPRPASARPQDLAGQGVGLGGSRRQTCADCARPVGGLHDMSRHVRTPVRHVTSGRRGRARHARAGATCVHNFATLTPTLARVDHDASSVHAEKCSTMSKLSRQLTSVRNFSWTTDTM